MNKEVNFSNSLYLESNNEFKYLDRQVPLSNRFSVYTEHDWDKIKQIRKLPKEKQLEMRAIAKILPFRVNQFVLDHLINWDSLENDPIFKLTFPQPGMIESSALDELVNVLKSSADRRIINAVISKIRRNLNPHPADQQSLNIPYFEGKRLEGIQHKYKETVLFFPSRGQTCHSYCSFCFRWPQFSGDKQWVISSTDTNSVYNYLRSKKQVTDFLITGGDPMVMKTRFLKNYLLPLTLPDFDHIQTIRIGTKSLTFWPQRFTTDDDAEDLIRFFEFLIARGKHVAIMAHFNHWRELEHPLAQKAIRRILNTGAVIRSQGPLLAHVNDDAQVWATLWEKQVRLGIIPYYFFIERDTGSNRYFEVTLSKALNIYKNAIKSVSGLARTARGPSMSAGPGKIEVLGTTEINNEKVFILRFIQGRRAEWVDNTFFSHYDEKATWFNQLKPAFGQEYFFFDKESQQLTDNSNPM